MFAFLAARIGSAYPKYDTAMACKLFLGRPCKLRNVVIGHFAHKILLYISGDNGTGGRGDGVPPPGAGQEKASY